ncbi:hypothetical protein J4E83_000772 [Alternaria metachromatica]|uniref:uncharacterized protein n=1 Tax=Alternaria metachromatica TaxID=283354 RepID=UPI0020C410E7|nr:uncharacterized protein J4E83_000772 [Alternaria metachromatica]KAI4637954.1 hypothetical protein J4E83_000772 [Alternaria metachromatica]
MRANVDAPYYQMRSGQFVTTPNSTNGAPPPFVSDDDEYDLSAPAPLASPPQHHLNPHLFAEHTARQTSDDHTLEENHNLVELLEAATAADQVAYAMDTGDTGTVTIPLQDRGKRRRDTSSPAADASHHADRPVNSKRRKTGGSTDPRLQDHGHNMHGVSVDDTVPPSSESLLNDARAAGVHSAAALFRRSSERTSRKYTRPPMSKLFMSLQLSPENFLQLQALAKGYMLDTSHPERQSCVGNRGKGDTDMVKLRLFNCVRDFLNEGVGEQFFGEDVEKPGEKDAIEAARALGEDKSPDAGERLTWPRDGNKIISLVTPLMRRMVTNERQRQYAIETRKGGAKKKDKEGSAEAVLQQGDDDAGRGVEQHLQPVFGHSLEQHPTPSQQTASSTRLTTVTPQVFFQGKDEKSDFREAVESNATTQPSLKLPTASPTEPNLSHINVFLVLASSSGRPGIKLDEKRITAEPQTHLAWYDYNDFMREVILLLRAAKDRYPEISPGIGFRDVEPGTDNLRGLAAAANALQTEHALHGTSSSFNGLPQSSEDDHASILPTPTSAVSNHPVFPADSHAETKSLPRYAIKSIGPQGWRDIRNADDWYSVLREKAFAVWADGVCNVLVELVDFAGVVG